MPWRHAAPLHRFRFRPAAPRPPEARWARWPGHPLYLYLDSDICTSNTNKDTCCQKYVSREWTSFRFGGGQPGGWVTVTGLRGARPPHGVTPAAALRLPPPAGPTREADSARVGVQGLLWLQAAGVRGKCPPLLLTPMNPPPEGRRPRSGQAKGPAWRLTCSSGVD